MRHSFQLALFASDKQSMAQINKYTAEVLLLFSVGIIAIPGKISTINSGIFPSFEKMKEILISIETKKFLKPDNFFGNGTSLEK